MWKLSKPPRYGYIFRLLAWGIISLVFILIGNHLVRAQQPSQWSPQERIPEFHDESSSPILLADQNHTVHAFNSEVYKGQKVIMYRQWTSDQGWTTPVDILLAPEGEARIMGAYLDQFGTIHLVFFGGDDRTANIFYSSASAASAGRSPAWSKPKNIGEMATTPSEANIVGDDAGNLFVLYSGNRDGNGLYLVHSPDSGNTWSEANPIFLTYDPERKPFALQMDVDGQGMAHAVWSNANLISGNSETVFYARQLDEPQNWTQPFALAQRGDGFEVDTPAIIAYKNELFVIYHDGSPTSRWMRRSRDGGQTWTESVKIFSQHVGSNGPASLVIDSNDDLHMFFGNRIGNNIHGLWHSIWEDGHWSAPGAVVSGLLFRDKDGDEGFDPSFARAVVSQGNKILVTWTTDPAAGRNGAWYSYITLPNAPELPVVASPTPLPTSTPSPTPTIVSSTATPAPSVTTAKMDYPTEDADVAISNPAIPLFYGIVPAIFIICGIFVLRILIK